MFKVLDNEFKTFSDVVIWAWNTHKIDLADDNRQLVFEDEQQEACTQLAEMIQAFTS